MQQDLSLNTICTPSKAIVAFKITDKMILVPVVANIADLENQICTLNDMGWFIWDKLDGVKTLKQVAEDVAAKFSSPREEIEKDMLGFITELMRCGICMPLNGVELKKQEEKKSTATKDACENLVDLASPNQFNEKHSSTYLKFGNLSNQQQQELFCSLKENDLLMRTSVNGYSMQPFIRNYDHLTIDLFENQPLKVGQVIAFNHWECENLVVHRIIKKIHSGWITKGDNRKETDGVVKADEIIGIITRVERNGKKVRFCLGPESKVIAFLNRGQGLVFFKKLWLFLRVLFKKLVNIRML